MTKLDSWSLTGAEARSTSARADTGRTALENRPEAFPRFSTRLPTDGLRPAGNQEFDQAILILLTAYASVETAVEAMSWAYISQQPFNRTKSRQRSNARWTTRLPVGEQFRTNAAGPTVSEHCDASGLLLSAPSVARLAVSPRDGAAHRRERRARSGRKVSLLYDRPARPLLNHRSALPKILEASCSATSEARSPMPGFKRKVCSRSPIAGQSFSMKSAR